MSSLTDLIGRAKAKAAAEKAQAEAKKLTATATKRPLTAEELDLRERAEWNPVALIFHIDNWKCACGEEGMSPGGLLIFSEHARMANATRLTAPRFESQIPEDLPRRYKYEERIVALCPICCETNGFLTQHTVAASVRVNPILGHFKGEGAGFVAEWQMLTAAEPESEPDEEDES